MGWGIGVCASTRGGGAHWGALAPPMSDENMFARLLIICGFDAMFWAL